MTISIKHNLAFVTEVDETHPTGIRLLALPDEAQILMLESMLKEFLIPVLKPVIDEINENGSYAILKVVE